MCFENSRKGDDLEPSLCLLFHFSSYKSGFKCAQLENYLSAKPVFWLRPLSQYFPLPSAASVLFCRARSQNSRPKYGFDWGQGTEPCKHPFHPHHSRTEWCYHHSPWQSGRSQLRGPPNAWSDISGGNHCDWFSQQYQSNPITAKSITAAKKVTGHFTSRPAMQWKKNSGGWIPVMNRPSINPPARGLVSNGANEGSDFPEIINGGLLPSNSIWPSRHEICIVLTVEPLAPDWTISCRLFSGNFFINPTGRHNLRIYSELIFTGSLNLWVLLVDLIGVFV